MSSYLEFEKSIAELEGKIRELRMLISGQGGDLHDVQGEISKLENKLALSLADLYKNLSPWQKTLVSRHPERPHAKDYIQALVEDFMPLAGDRTYGEDHALITGFGRLASGQLKGYSVAILGHEKGHDTKSRLKHNFGMVRPEGYRKAVRIMEMADRFSIPVLSFIDTAGAYPGVGAEERGQAEAIARATEKCLSLGVPLIATIIGEGGSGGALAIAAANEVLMLEHAIYSVISPEGAASILWRDFLRAEEAAYTMKITAQDLEEMGIIDHIIPEPMGGAHRGRQEILRTVGAVLDTTLASWLDHSTEEIRMQRQERFLAIGRTL